MSEETVNYEIQETQHHIVSMQLSSLDETLRLLREKIIFGLENVYEGVGKTVDYVKSSGMPRNLEFYNALQKTDRMIMRYNELYEISKSIKRGLAIEEIEKQMKKARRGKCQKLEG